MKISRSDIKQSAIYKTMRNRALKNSAVTIFVSAISWFGTLFSCIIYIIPAAYFSYRLWNDCIKALNLTKAALGELESDAFSETQKQAFLDENLSMFGVMTDHGIIVRAAFIPYESIKEMHFMPKKWRWDAVLLGFGLRSTPAYLSITYTVNGKMNKVLKNLPTNRDISADIEEFTSKVTAHPGTKIAVHNEYHYVN